MQQIELKKIIEALLLAAGEPLSLDRIADVFPIESRPTMEELRAALNELASANEVRPTELKELASGFSLQVKAEFTPWISRLWQERTPRYSRALLETLALIAYRQPITRAEIEELRGVTVSSYTMKTLLDHEWVRVVGQREVPGRPSLYATTRKFLDHFNMKALDELPPLSALTNLDEILMEDKSPLTTLLQRGEIEGQSPLTSLLQSGGVEEEATLVEAEEV